MPDFRRRVLNTFRTMITDEDILEKEDMHILDRIRDFCVKAEVTTSVAAAKQLVVLIDRVVRLLSSYSYLILILISTLETRWRRHQNHQYAAYITTTANPSEKSQEIEAA